MRVASVGIQAFDKPLHHRAQIARGVDPVSVRLQFKGRTVKIGKQQKNRAASGDCIAPTQSSTAKEKIRAE